MCERCVFWLQDAFRKHVVAVSVVRGKDASLMVLRPEGVPEPSKWHDPGGKVELGQTYMQAATEEMWQEVRLPKDTVLTPTNEWLAPRSELVFHHFVAEAPDGWEPVMQEGQPAFAWVPIDAEE